MSDFLKAFNSLIRAYGYKDDPGSFKCDATEDMMKDIEHIKAEIVKNRFIRVLKKFVKKDGSVFGSDFK